MLEYQSFRNVFGPCIVRASDDPKAGLIFTNEGKVYPVVVFLDTKKRRITVNVAKELHAMSCVRHCTGKWEGDEKSATCQEDCFIGNATEVAIKIQKTLFGHVRSGFCSVHRENGHFECRQCYPDLSQK